MAKTKEVTCKCGCGRKKEVRIADLKRGWGKFFSKSCKAKFQSRSQRVNFDIEDDSFLGSPAQAGYFGHGQN